MAGILCWEVDVFSFLGWVILSLWQMLSVTSLRGLLGLLAWLSASHQELPKQPAALVWHVAITTLLPRQLRIINW